MKIILFLGSITAVQYQYIIIFKYLKKNIKFGGKCIKTKCKKTFKYFFWNVSKKQLKYFFKAMEWVSFSII